MLQGARQHDLWCHRHGAASSGFRREPAFLLDLRGDIVVRQGGRAGLDGQADEILLHDGDFATRALGDAGVRCALQRLVRGELHRIEARHLGGEHPRGHGQGGGNADEGPDLDDLAVGEADGDGCAETLLRRGDHEVSHEAVPLRARAMSSSLGAERTTTAARSGIAAKEMSLWNDTWIAAPMRPAPVRPVRYWRRASAG